MIPLRRLPVISLVALAVLAPGCGKKGPPLPPLRPVPAAVELTARRLGDTVRLEFTVPDRNQDGSRPADLSRIEIYGLTIDPSGRSPELQEFLRNSVVVAVVDVRPPSAADSPAVAGAPADARPAQGATVWVEERLTPELRAPVTFAPRPGARRAAPAPLTIPEPGTGGPTRTYLALGLSGRTRWSPPSPRLEVTLERAPDRPQGLKVGYAETSFSLTWDPLTPDPWMPIWPLMKYQKGFNVYELAAEEGASPSDTLLEAKPLNEKPLVAPAFQVPLARFGVTRCFAVRTIETLGERTIESEPSATVCETPVDTFAPAAPTGLAAVADPGSINLIWNANAEPDLAGYLVLRGEAPGETLRAVTASPIRETTYRDTGVRAGVRYIYVIVAVDDATPPNISAQSARVEESAR